MNDRLMTAEDLKNFLRVSWQTLFDWRESGYLPSDYNFGTDNQPLHIYLHSSIDRFLQRRALHPKQPPPQVSKLLAYQAQTGLPALLTVAEVEVRWDVGRETVANLLANGVVPGLALSTETNNTKHNRLIRIPAPPLNRVATISDHPNAVTGHFAAKMLAIGERLFSEVMKRRLLQPVRVISSKHQTYVSITSLHHLLASLVFNYTVDEWWEMQLDHDFSDIVSRSEVLKRLHIHHRRLMVAMEREIPYIKTPLSLEQSHLKLPFYLVRRWHESLQERKTIPSEAAKIFGIPEQLATQWIAEQAFCRMLGTHRLSKTCPRPACIAQYIRKYAIGTFNESDWLLWIYQDHIIPSVLPTGLQLSQKDIDQATKTGTLKGIQLPNGVAVYTPVASILAARRKERLEERRIMGG